MKARTITRIGSTSAAALLLLLSVPSWAGPEPEDIDPTRVKPVMWWQKPVVEAEMIPVPFAEGERLHYSVRLMGKEAAAGEAWVGKRGKRDGRQIQRITGRLRTVGGVKSVYPVEDDIGSLLDLATVAPTESTFALQHALKPKRKVALYFFRPRGNVTLVRGSAEWRDDGGGKKAVFEDRSPTIALDPLSAFYHLRSRKMKVGDTFPIFVHQGARMYRVDIRVAAQEKVVTEVGEHAAFRLDGRAVRADGSRPGWHQNLRYWVSTDAKRLPLKIAFEMPIGDVVAVLDGYKGLETEKKKAPPAAPKKKVTAPKKR